MSSLRVGFGYDSHRFDATRALVLGGVTIPDAPGLAAHSDGDALAHALVDALLGATARGDVGARFPDSDAQWRGADSLEMLRTVAQENLAAGWRTVNVDATVICETPRLRPHVEAMRARLADALGVDPDAVSVKGKTNEKMDATGAGVGLAVHCVALVEKI